MDKSDSTARQPILQLDSLCANGARCCCYGGYYKLKRAWYKIDTVAEQLPPVNCSYQCVFTMFFNYRGVKRRNSSLLRGAYRNQCNACRLGRSWKFAPRSNVLVSKTRDKIVGKRRKHGRSYIFAAIRAHFFHGNCRVSF